jgi:hypothetical protein
VRLGAGRDLPTGSFVPGIIGIVSRRIVVAWITKPAWSDALFQFFDLDQRYIVMFVIHMFTVVAMFIGESANG